MKPDDSATTTRSLALAAMGVIFGDIGTSPLYTMRVAFAAEGGLALGQETLFGVISLIFWSILIIVTMKYILVMLRFDYLGEGGVLALLSLTFQKVSGSPAILSAVTGLGIVAASLFFGDAMITPAMSLLAAVEGITVVAPGLHAWVVPIALVILVTLFSVQKRGTASVGRIFGPVMLAWFLVLGLLGIASIIQRPDVLFALQPKFALWFFTERPGLVVIAMGAVFLCVTGAEAMYADLGHFGRKPIRLAWFAIVLPCLMLNYLGQGALLMNNPQALSNPFFLLAPEILRIPLIVLATLATIIASQAVISGAFSVSQQASRLNLLPRLKVRYTSETARGQVFVPVVNTVLMIAVLLLVVGFGTSDNLAAAYGLAVSGDLVIGSVLLAVVVLASGVRRMYWLLPLLGVFLALELVFLFANATKFMDGGWFPVVVALLISFVMSTWRSGLDSLRIKKDIGPKAMVDGLSLDLGDVHRVPGTAVFFCSASSGCPSSFLHNLKHNKVVHEQTYFLTVDFDDAPRISDDERLSVTRGQNGIYRLVARFGFREDPDITLILRIVRERGLEVHEDFASFFTSKPVIVSVSKRGFFRFRRKFFGWMLQNSPSVASYLRLPPNRVIELGAQVAI